MHFSYIIAPFCFALPVMAATISTSATCSVPGQSVTSTTGNCALSTAGQLPTTALSVFSVSGAMTPTAVPGGQTTAFLFSVVSQLETNIEWQNAPASSATASITFDYKIMLSTSGPARSGFFAFAGSQGAQTVTEFTADGSAYAVIGNSHGISYGIGSSVSSQVCVPFGTAVQAHIPLPCGLMFQAQLGDAMAFEFRGTFHSVASTNGTPVGLLEGGAYFDTQVMVYAFEADGVTPAAISNSPEPGTLALLAVGAVLFWFAWRGTRKG